MNTNDPMKVEDRGVIETGSSHMATFAIRRSKYTRRKKKDKLG